VSPNEVTDPGVVHTGGGDEARLSGHQPDEREEQCGRSGSERDHSLDLAIGPIDEAGSQCHDTDLHLALQ